MSLEEIRFRANLECEDERDYLNAEEDRDRLLAALDAILNLHAPVDALMYGSKNAHKVQVCTGCGQDDGNWNRWPCPTVAAVYDALGQP